MKASDAKTVYDLTKRHEEFKYQLDILNKLMSHNKGVYKLMSHNEDVSLEVCEFKNSFNCHVKLTPEFYNIIIKSLKDSIKEIEEKFIQLGVEID